MGSTNQKTHLVPQHDINSVLILGFDAKMPPGEVDAGWELGSRVAYIRRWNNSAFAPYN